MSLTLFIVAAVAASLATAYVVTVRTPAPALASETTMVGIADPAAETLPNGCDNSPAGTNWQLTTVDDLNEAEDLLDCLEVQGFEHRELVVLGNSCFAVRWR